MSDDHKSSSKSSKRRHSSSSRPSTSSKHRDHKRESSLSEKRSRRSGESKSSDPRKSESSSSKHRPSSSTSGMERTSSSSSKRPRSYGNWTEHFSSSGKRYFYNFKTEVSQWEKPPEWRDYERAQLAANAAAVNAQIQNQPAHHSQQDAATSSSASSAARNLSVNVHVQRRSSYEKPVVGTPVAQRSTSGLEAAKALTASPVVSTPTSATLAEVPLRLTHISAVECNQDEMPMDVDEESREGSDAKEDIKKEDPKVLFADNPITFDPEKYMKFLPPDFQLRKNIIDHYESEALRAEARAFQIQTKIDQISWDVKYTKSLVQNAQLKAALTGKRLTYIREDIKRLEEKKPTRSFSTASQPSFPSSSSTQHHS
ncbi:hypothetical protein L596_008163 [Steinernema carpocapsae]|uniref:WW domain-containing protein n=1 Tax=Steinernema carpocapsae TaxID=34508 RepID=A0A4U5PBQ0_STECR|nr:hypothetical protein L596_008163 [Steinernema carpocapsae]